MMVKENEWFLGNDEVEEDGQFVLKQVVDAMDTSEGCFDRLCSIGLDTLEKVLPHVTRDEFVLIPMPYWRDGRPTLVSMSFRECKDLAKLRSYTDDPCFYGVHLQRRYVKERKTRSIFTSTSDLTRGADVPGDVTLRSCCSCLSVLPEDMSILGCLDVVGCQHFVSLPDVLYIGGDMNLSFCDGVIELPPGVCVEGSVSFIHCANLSILPDNLVVKGDLTIENCEALCSLPDGLRVEGSANFIHCANLSILPNNLVVKGDLIIKNCESLCSLPGGLSVESCLVIEECNNLASLPKDVRVGGCLSLTRCAGLASLTDLSGVKASVYIRECPTLSALPHGLTLRGNLIMVKCEGITSLPGGLNINGDLKLIKCQRFNSLPEDFRLGGSLCVRECDMFASIPESLSVDGDLEFEKCSITVFPSDVIVGGTLRVHDCEQLVVLGDGLTVGTDMSLVNVPLQKLPEDLRIGSSIRLGCPELQSLPDELKIVRGNLTLRRCQNLKSIPKGMKVDGNCRILSCTKLTILPKGLEVGGSFECRCSALTSLPPGMVVGGTLTLSECEELMKLESPCRVGGDLIISDCIALTLLPDRLSVGWNAADTNVPVDFYSAAVGSVLLSGSPGLVSFPGESVIRGHLDLRACASLQHLPDVLDVGGDLLLDDCTSLVSLPLELIVEGSILLRNCTSLVSLPENFTVGRNLWLEGCTGVVDLPDCVFEWPLTLSVRRIRCETRTEYNFRWPGETRRIFLYNSGISKKDLQKQILPRMEHHPLPKFDFVGASQPPRPDQLVTLTRSLCMYRGYRGVIWNEDYHVWVATITDCSKDLFVGYVGTFRFEKLAALMADLEHIKLHGTALNFDENERNELVNLYEEEGGAQLKYLLECTSSSGNGKYTEYTYMHIS